MIGSSQVDRNVFAFANRNPQPAQGPGEGSCFQHYDRAPAVVAPREPTGPVPSSSIQKISQVSSEKMTAYNGLE